MTTRLPQDGGVLGYWGFDEANPADVAVDESGNGNNLVVYNAPAVVPARLGNGRQFDGVATYAQPADSSIFQVGPNTLLVWFILDSVNQAGDQLRPVITLEGPGAAATEDNALGLYVNANGALVYTYSDLSRNLCVFTSAAGLIRVNRYYSVAVVREQAPAPPDGNNGLFLRAYVNNEAISWASLTVGGAPQPDPNAEAPAAAGPGGAAILKVGAASKSPSMWHGVLDELSIHSSRRAKKPYLDAAYFRLTMATTFNRLTSQGTVKVLAASDMGGGTRWWCYERDQSVYVIRENSLGLFSAEVQLTQGRDLAVGAPAPGGVEKPRLAYDADTDTLVIAFIAAGRVYKVTANSTDVPATLIMPFSADVSNSIKATDSVDIIQASGDEGHLPWSDRYDPTFDDVPATIGFLHVPSFGVSVYGSAAAYAVVRTAGGASTVVGYASGDKQTALPAAAGLYWHVPVASRVPGATYRAYPIIGGAIRQRPVSNVITDDVDEWATNAGLPATWNPDAVIVNRDGGGFIDTGDFASGEGSPPKDMVLLTTYPQKLLILDSMLGAADEGVERIATRIDTTYPLKQLIMDAMFGGIGESTLLTATLGNWRVQR